jgi:hypothetical protein
MEEKKNEVVVAVVDTEKKEVKKNIDDVWDDGTEFVNKSLTYDEKTGDYFFHRETVKKEEKVAPKPASKYTPKEANSKKNKNIYKPKPSVKLNSNDEEDYDYENDDDYDEDHKEFYKESRASRE